LLKYSFLVRLGNPFKYSWITPFVFFTRLENFYSFLLNILLNNSEKNEQISHLILGKYFPDPYKKRIPTSQLAQANFGPYVAQTHIHICNPNQT
jgi:hypothetical protein